nr:MAG TPA: hypothetical protein [Bacteriophage sp.]
MLIWFFFSFFFISYSSILICIYRTRLIRLKL